MKLIKTQFNNNQLKNGLGTSIHFYINFMKQATMDNFILITYLSKYFNWYLPMVLKISKLLEKKK